MKYQRLQDLRVDHDLRQQDVADILCCQRNVYRRYECGEREIPTWVLVKLSEYYHVSIDYLLGLTDEKKPYQRPMKDH
ncbi:MAG: helix-turn-helix transcriptional regulator [Lachnospiraceae bacterium]|nr:helix-turn-helix transcriptional regulator [Lachnospiraceae bacterium]